QDPLNPKQDTEFIAQMAQFSALEQAKSMQQDLSNMRQDQQLIQANSMLGRLVELQVDPDTTTTGIVNQIQIVAGTPEILVNGQAYDLTSVRSISQVPTKSH